MANLPIIIHDDINLSPDLLTFLATDTDAGSQYHVDNVRDLRPYTRWKALNGTTDKNLTGDWTGGLVSVDAWAVIGHNFASAGVTCGLDVFEGSWVDAGSGDIVPTNDNEIIVGILPATKTDNAFQLRMTGSPFTAAPEVGVVLWGMKLEFPRFLLTGFDPQGLRVEAEQSISQTGEVLGSTIKFKEHNIIASFNRITETWIANTFMPVWNTHLSLLKPFVFAWRPVNLESPTEDSRFVALQPGVQLNVPYDPKRQSLSLPMRGLVRP